MGDEAFVFLDTLGDPMHDCIDMSPARHLWPGLGEEKQRQKSRCSLSRIDMYK